MLRYGEADTHMNSSREILKGSSRGHVHRQPEERIKLTPSMSGFTCHFNASCLFWGIASPFMTYAGMYVFLIKLLTISIIITHFCL